MSSVPLIPVRKEDHGKIGSDGEPMVYMEIKQVIPRPRLNITGSPVFVAKLEEFVEALQKMIDVDTKKKFPDTNINDIKLTVENGTKNVRIVSNGVNSCHRCVWGFVKKENGDILKAAGWKAPAKHARGNIYNDEMLKGCGVYGPDYLR